MHERRTIRLLPGLPALATALSLATAGAAFAGVEPLSVHSHVPPAGSAERSSACGDPRGVTVYAFPERPAEGGMLRFVAVSETPRDATLVVIGPAGERLASVENAQGGPPYSWTVEIPATWSGTYRARFAVALDGTACAEAYVAGEGPPPPPRSSSSLWPIDRVWDRETENLYSVWVARLFDDPLDASPSWKSLHEVTRDPVRNFLHDSLGLGEDSEAGITLEPDCADLPYFLRAYFAWKLRLPFVYSKCYSMAPGAAPVCNETYSNLDPAPPGKETLAVLQRFFARSVADTAHSATGRTAALDDRSDVYPVRIGVDTLRPGTVYIDPYGHVLVVARRLDQTRTSSGVLLAVDAQPDGTVARKQYWRGNFLFALDPNGSAPGFKRFRPAMPDGPTIRTLSNAEILDHPAYGDWSLEQYENGVEGFYDRVDAALSPHKRTVEQVLREVVDSLEQQVKGRVASVQGGEDYVAKGSPLVSMPEGAAIFQTVGAWEDYATPSRDMRLLIAIDVVRGFPESVVRRAERFVLPKGRGHEQMRREIEALLSEEIARRTFEYVRSDGSPWTLRLSEVIERATDLEMAYNPNDCVETRWGAPADSVEAVTCRRRAPAEQVRRMEQLRDWFRTRSRPAT